MAFNNKIVVGDYENGNIYAFDLTDFSDNGSIQKWLRTWRALPPGPEQPQAHRAAAGLQIDMESGVGLNQAKVATRRSCCAGATTAATWSNEHWSAIGKIGEYYRYVTLPFVALALTMKLRDRVYELSGTDPVKISIMGAELIISPTNA